MPGTFGCGRTAPLAPRRRTQNPDICENSTKPHAGACNPQCPISGAHFSSVHRTQSAPASHSNENSVSPSRIDSGHDIGEDSECSQRYSPNHTCDHKSELITTFGVYATNYSSGRCEKDHCSLNNRQHCSVGAFRYPPDLEGNYLESSGSRLNEEPSFHQIYGPALRFHNSSHNPSTVDINFTMGNVDVENVPPTFKECDNRSSRGKTPITPAGPDIYNPDGDNVTHNHPRGRHYSPRDRNKQKLTHQPLRFPEGNHEIVPVGEVVNADSQPITTKYDSDSIPKDEERIQRGRSVGRGNSPRRPSFKQEFESEIAQDSDRRDKNFTRGRGNNSQNTNYHSNYGLSDITRKTNAENLHMRSNDQLDSTNDQNNSHMFGHVKDIVKNTSERSPTRHKCRSSNVPHTATQKNYENDSHAVKVPETLQEVSDIEAVSDYTGHTPRSPNLNLLRDHQDTHRPDHPHGCRNRQISDGPWIQPASNNPVIDRKDLKGSEDKKQRKIDTCMDLPMAELTQEWMRFRNAEDAGDWSVCGEEGADSPPMLRFMNFLRNQYSTKEGDSPKTSSSRPTPNISGSRSHVDLITQHETKCRYQPQRPSSAYATPERVYGGGYQAPHRAAALPPIPSDSSSPTTIYPSQVKPQRKRDAPPLWESLPPALQVEHAAVITNQLCRAMALQAAQQQRVKSSSMERPIQKKSPSNESHASRVSDSPLTNVPKHRSKERFNPEESDTARHESSKNYDYYNKTSRREVRVDQCWYDNEVPKSDKHGVTALRGGGASTNCDRPWCPRNVQERPTVQRSTTTVQPDVKRCSCRDGVPIAVFNFTECAATFQQYLHPGDCGDEGGDLCMCE